MSILEELKVDAMLIIVLVLVVLISWVASYNVPEEPEGISCSDVNAALNEVTRGYAAEVYYRIGNLRAMVTPGSTIESTDAMGEYFQKRIKLNYEECLITETNPCWQMDWSIITTTDSITAEEIAVILETDSVYVYGASNSTVGTYGDGMLIGLAVLTSEFEGCGFEETYVIYDSFLVNPEDYELVPMGTME
jgi:hypothetical protein